MTEQHPARGRPDANNCFVCGPDNPVGLRIAFHLDEQQICHGRFTPGQDHQGFDGVTHGGILFSVLDDVMANWLFLQGIRGYTARCEVRFRAPLPPATPVDLEGRCLKRKGRMVVMQGRVLRADSGELIAEAQATFMEEPETSRRAV
jgi:acyl-coenzyme A thioesterase PaaI-like protein